MNKALLVFHAPLDETVGIDNAAKIFAAAKHPKSFVSLDGADHLLHKKEDAVYVAGVIAAWADRYVTGAPPSGTQAPLTAAPGTVVVTESGDGKFAQWVSVGGRHVLLADEPEDVGGNDLGGSPYELLLAGLGACTSMTLRMYAERKGLHLDKVTVTLKHEKSHAADCTDCESKNGKIDHIERHIVLEGDLTDEQRKRLLEIADKCPVHKTLHSEVLITTHEDNI